MATKQPQPKPGMPPLNRIPIFDHKGNMRGHVGKTATQATVARFLGRHGAKLGKQEGRAAWIGDVPPPPPKPDIPPKDKSEPTTQAAAVKHALEISLKAAKGSVP